MFAGAADAGSTDDPKGPCAGCQQEASQRCANCRQVYYCRRECQRGHWKDHKNDCKPFKVEKNSTLGRYLVATRDFKAGDVIMKEEPIVVGPKQLTEPVCLGCYKRVDGSYRCRHCTWPMCGPACEEAPAHKPECTVGKVMGSPIEIQDFNEVNHFYEVVTPLRCLLLKKKSPKKYEELMALESHFNDRKGTHIYTENQKRVVNMLRNYFMLVDFPPEDLDASEASIHNMTGIIDTNAVDIPLPESEIVGIYPTYSMLEHSCTPNTKYRVSSTYQLTLKAAVDIKEGEHLSTIYTHILWGTAARRDLLKSTRFFMCTCRRCADPTELGTNFSALRCNKCPLGFLMSAAPLDPLADWICTSCNATMTADEANDITLQLGEEVEQTLEKGNAKDIENLIEKSSSTVVHPNHFHLFAARHSLLQMLGREASGLNEDVVKKKEELCREFLKTCTAIDPGMCKLASYVGVALYEYHLAVLARTRLGPTDTLVDKVALKTDLDTAKALLQQCIKVLQEELPESPEGQLRLLAEQNLMELNLWESPSV
ncbi:SET domain-containing protein SmydA-8 [Hyalella azteca]|uniref:SET domain-containing protein SmydA-8 n=1 Tax=Hyalella azteca TaxID=294128 RepID=A0A8B7P268_HYAAZ|nr:SET domain-containing protein SmydA-8 [Hyalella azteca]